MSQNERAVLLLVVAASVAPLAAGGDVTGKITSPRLKSMADVVVYLEGPGLPATPPEEPAVMDQREIRFLPHVLPVVKGTTVEFRNSDATPHNVNASSPSKKLNVTTYPNGRPARELFDQAGVVEILCNIHQQMAAFVVVVPTSAFTTCAADGAFAIRGIPAGSYTLVAQHPQLPPESRAVTVEPEGEAFVELGIP